MAALSTPKGEPAPPLAASAPPPPTVEPVPRPPPPPEGAEPLAVAGAWLDTEPKPLGSSWSLSESPPCEPPPPEP